MEIAKPSSLQVRPGTDAEVAEVLRGSKAVWGGGISLEDYVEYHTLIRKHEWSRENFQHLILTDEQGQLFSSCKTYLHQVRVEDQELRMAVIGAIFTPLQNRGMGYASQMLEYLLDTLGDQGVDLIMLFSDIGAEFYARFGFRLVVKKDPIYGFSEKGLAPAEIAIFNHLPAEVQEWDRTYDRTEKFSLLRSPEYYSLLSERISWHQQYMGFKEQKVIVSFADQSYLWADLSRWRMTVRKFGTGSADAETALGRILAAVRDKVGFHDFAGWLPQDFESYRFLKLKEKEPRNRTLMMMATLNERARPVHQLTPDEIQFWLADYF